jgi:hypothetical protein
MINQWEKSEIWKKGVWNFEEHADTDVALSGKIFPKFPRAQYVPQSFYYNGLIRLYTLENLAKLESDYLEAFRIPLKISTIGKSTALENGLNAEQKKKISKIYAEDIVAYEKINML